MCACLQVTCIILQRLLLALRNRGKASIVQGIIHLLKGTCWDSLIVVLLIKPYNLLLHLLLYLYLNSVNTSFIVIPIISKVFWKYGLFYAGNF